MQLAEAFYKQAGLAQKILGDERNPQQVIPEEEALARLETGDVDAIWAYSTESATRRLPALELPPQINLGEPAYAKQYATASVTVGSKTYHGAPSVYALTIPTNAANPAGGAAFVAFLLGAQGQALLRDAGLTILAPGLSGDTSAVPAALANVLK